MRSFGLTLLVLCAVAHSAVAQARHTDTLFVSDRYLVADTTIGAQLIAKFDAVAARTAMLRLDASVATVNGKRWVLGDILVTLDINGNRAVATWTIAGPKAVIDAYLADFRARVRSRSPIYDFGIRLLAVRCACD